jgi:hypothetical protein
MKREGVRTSGEPPKRGRAAPPCWEGVGRTLVAGSTINRRRDGRHAATWPWRAQQRRPRRNTWAAAPPSVRCASRRPSPLHARDMAWLHPACPCGRRRAPSGSAEADESDARRGSEPLGRMPRNETEEDFFGSALWLASHFTHACASAWLEAGAPNSWNGFTVVSAGGVHVFAVTC